jgi:hypothetical protein
VRKHLAETIKQQGRFEMFGFGKPKKTEADILADHVTAAAEAKAKGDWATAAHHFGRAANMTEGAGHEPHSSYLWAGCECQEKARDVRAQARRNELGLS